jgi:enterochelin esterase-like enzyme
MTFRTLEISDPSLESEHLRFITVKSTHLGGRGDICLFVPENAEGKELPLITLLHGVYGSCWSWAFKGAAHLTAHQLISRGRITPMIIAMPSDGLWGDGSGYFPHVQHNYEQWIVKDVPQAVSAACLDGKLPNKHFICGLSMGGFGALRLGIKHQDLFSGISAHSSITNLEQMSEFIEEPLDQFRISNKQESSVWGTIESKNGCIPPLRFDCGKEDQLIEANRKLHQQLSESQIDHVYTEFPGGHEWEYWQSHLVESLLFFDKLIGS